MSWMNHPRLQTLTLLCRLLSPCVSGPAVRAELAAADWEAIVGLANRYFLAPALWAGLARKGLLDAMPEAARHYLGAMYEINERRNAELREQLEQAVAVLNRAGITPLLLKGAVDLATPQAYPGARFMLDLDLWVGEEAQAAAAALQADGYDYRDDNHGAGDHHHLPGLFKAGVPARIEVHKRLLSSHGLDSTIFDSGPLAPITLANGGRARVLPLAGQLLFNFVHAEISHGAYRDGYLELRQMAAFAELAQDGDTERAALEAVLTEHGLAPQWQAHGAAMAYLFGLGDRANFNREAGRNLHWRLWCFAVAPSWPRLWRAALMLKRLQTVFSRARLERRYAVPWHPVLTRLHHGRRLLEKYWEFQAWRELFKRLRYSKNGWDDSV